MKNKRLGRYLSSVGRQNVSVQRDKRRRSHDQHRDLLNSVVRSSMQKQYGDFQKMLSNPCLNIAEPFLNLTKLILGSNKLQELPDLQDLPKNMNKLEIGKNSLTNISGLLEMGIQFIGRLTLWYNITTLTKHIFQKISAIEINLANDIEINLAYFSENFCHSN